MSVLIKGMEMPTSCSRCFCMASCKLWKNIMAPEFYRHRNCPLVSVPPHGRLIDADSLIADVRAHSESYFADDFAHEWVDVAPTIIPEEEV